MAGAAGLVAAAAPEAGAAARAVPEAAAGPPGEALATSEEEVNLLSVLVVIEEVLR